MEEESLEFQVSEDPVEEETGQDYEDDLLVGIQRTQAIALTAIVCVSFLGNVFVLSSLSLTPYSSRPSRKILNQLLSHVCLGDLAYAILTILPRTVNILTFPRFYGGYFVCRMVKFLQLIPVYVCPFLTVTCTVERYSTMKRKSDQSDSMANRRRISWRESRSFAHVLSFWAWLSAIVLSAPNILAFRYEYLDDAGTIGACVYQVRESYERLWMSFLTLATWVMPLLIVSALSTAILIGYYGRNQGRKGSVADSRVKGHKMDGENIRVVNFFLSMILVKFILWTPFNITNIIGSYWKSIQIMAVTLASNCSCCVPPLSYVLFYFNNIRENIWGIIWRCSGKDDTLEVIGKKWTEMEGLINHPIPVQQPCQSRRHSIDKSLVTFTV